MAKRAVKYAVIDAFTDTPFKGSPAAVCLLEDEFLGAVDEEWMQSVAKEFNFSQTAFLSRASSTADSDSNGIPNPRFDLRWFTPVAEASRIWKPAKSFENRRFWRGPSDAQVSALSNSRELEEARKRKRERA